MKVLLWREQQVYLMCTTYIQEGRTGSNMERALPEFMVQKKKQQEACLWKSNPTH